MCKCWLYVCSGSKGCSPANYNDTPSIHLPSYRAAAASPPGRLSLRRPAGFCRSSCCAPAPPCRPCSEYIPSSSSLTSDTNTNKNCRRDTTFELRALRHAKGYRASIHQGGRSEEEEEARWSLQLLRFKHALASHSSLRFHSQRRLKCV